MTYNELFNRNVIINSLPLTGITGKPLCDIIMLRVDSARAIDAFNERMQEALKKIKEEKFPRFDEESAKPEADRCEDYQGWLEELEKLYTDMRSAEAAKEVETTLPKVTRDILTAFCGQGVEGTVTFPGGTEEEPNLIPRLTVLHMLAEMVED